jgi:hypothetical protein
MQEFEANTNAIGEALNPKVLQETLKRFSVLNIYIYKNRNNKNKINNKINTEKRT